MAGAGAGTGLGALKCTLAISLWTSLSSCNSSVDNLNRFVFWAITKMIKHKSCWQKVEATSLVRSCGSKRLFSSKPRLIKNLRHCDKLSKQWNVQAVCEILITFG
ncbi:Hypothetical_protein [Hexamita inflata]|uniref:Hypothetical_protein n=1 Tax=Hexamita inflata TaxID=28002 RepID=A0AA86PI81_9EUKA|nr:Hypothetical protein HINF_LOCUS27785 [Hexamita inflata]